MYDDTQDPDSGDPSSYAPTEGAGSYLTYDLLGTDPDGKAVYRGSDGKMYTDGGGMSGFVAYDGPGVQAPTTNPAPPPPPGPAPGPAPTPTATATPAPVFTAPGYTPPPAFSYADFVAPNPSDLNNDPAYQYTLKTGQDQIQKSAAARGVLNTGGTINDLLGNAADVASNGYHDLFARGMQTYLTNRGNAVDQYNQNYQTQYQDPFKFNYQGLQDQYNSQIHNYDTSRQYDWYGKLFDEQKLNDAFDKKYRIYSTL
jgi:hypothetical protein